MILNVLFSTINEGIFKIADIILPQRDDVIYLISHQVTDEKFRLVPEKLNRSDISISQIQGSGVTKSRNNALRLAAGDIGLFSDDDVRYKNEYFDKILEIFIKDNNLDVGLFKIKTPPGAPEYKKYPRLEKCLKRCNQSVGTIEIAFRIDRWKEVAVFFDERFGAGAPVMKAGDEGLFIDDCIHAGLKVKFLPYYIVEHPYESTQKNLHPFDKDRNLLYGGLDARRYGWWSVPKAFIKTLRLIPALLLSKRNPFDYLKQRLQGAFYILHFKSEKK